MSNATNIERKIAKAGFTQERAASPSTTWVRGNARILVSCNPPDGGVREVTGIHVCRTSEQSDAQTDYFPGAWFDSAVRALRHADWINSTAKAEVAP